MISFKPYKYIFFYNLNLFNQLLLSLNRRESKKSLKTGFFFLSRKKNVVCINYERCIYLTRNLQIRGDATTRCRMKRKDTHDVIPFYLFFLNLPNFEEGGRCPIGSHSYPQLFLLTAMRLPSCELWSVYSIAHQAQAQDQAQKRTAIYFGS